MSPERALEPELLICDPHHHLYLPGSAFHDGPYGIEDLRRDIGGHRVTQTVFVETQSAYRTDGSATPLAPVGETEWVVEQLETGGLVEGIVGFADLMLGEAVEQVLLSHIDAAAGRFRGVRFRESNTDQPKPPPDWLTSQQLLAAVGMVDRLGLVLDLHVLYDSLPQLAALARAMPNATIVLDHLGAPVIPSRSRQVHEERTREEMLRAWRRGMATVAQCENVVIKIGGIGSAVTTDPTALAQPVSSESIAAYWARDLLFAIEQFGPDRSMMESNFPIDGFLCDYTVLWNTYKRVTRSFSTDERRKLFHDTAARVYGLTPTDARMG